MFQTVPMIACASPKAAYATTPPTTTAAPKYGTMIPSRIFVGGIDFKVKFYLLIFSITISTFGFIKPKIVFQKMT